MTHEATIADKAYPYISLLKVEVNDKSIVLRGRSRNFYGVQLALSAATKLFPDHDIVNHILVERK